MQNSLEVLKLHKRDWSVKKEKNCLTSQVQKKKKPRHITNKGLQGDKVGF